MKDVLDKLIKLLQLEKTDEDVYEGASQDLGFRNLFGGQVLGQALVATSNTVENRSIHSLHGYFLRPGDAKLGVRYEVERIRDGRSFSTRRVIAKQQEKVIFNLSASFQIPEEGFDHQVTAPFVPGPDDFPSDLELMRKYADKIPERIRDKMTCDKPFEIRTVDPINWFNPRKRPPVKYTWFRTVHKTMNDPMVNKALLAYASDFSLLGTSLLPHGTSVAHSNIHVASLDHAMWFHRDVNFDDWLLYCTDSPSASNARGYTRGQIFNKAGQLVASVSQEGLIRST